ncbi:hypothetical protein [Paraferrimonas sedimenticola]|uniref:Uncharacterized protein n=1 Tax=Paraferrimonas sedimenticola TaxID=375674 RepID=A0AA37RTJ1_9GAMM|nr:hypothetical protein [Paraferrimonas sedimenticola]GLP95014.1 hypothetical protein GCM10007895_03200 [Paraferrimonas sedimenticola]
MKAKLPLFLASLMMVGCTSSELTSPLARQIHHGFLTTEQGQWQTELGQVVMTTLDSNQGLTELRLSCQTDLNQSDYSASMSAKFVGQDIDHAPSSMRLHFGERFGYFGVDEVFQPDTHTIVLTSQLSASQVAQFAEQAPARIDAFGGNFSRRLEIANHAQVGEFFERCQARQTAALNAPKPAAPQPEVYRPKALSQDEVQALDAQLLFSTDVDFLKVLNTQAHELVPGRHLKVGNNTAEFSVAQRLSDGSVLLRSDKAEYADLAIIVHNAPQLNLGENPFPQLNYYRFDGLVEYKTVMGANRYAIELHNLTDAVVAQLNSGNAYEQDEAQLAE